MDESSQSDARDSARSPAVLQAALTAIDAAIARPTTQDSMLEEVLRAVLALFECDRAWLVGPTQSSAEVWRIYAEQTAVGIVGRGRDALFSAAAVDRFTAMVAAAAPMRDDIGAGHGVPAAARTQHQIRAQLALAIQPPGALPCVLGLHQCTYDRVWTEQDCAWLTAIGQRLGPAISQLHAYQLLRESELRLAQIERIAHVGSWEIDFKNFSVRTSAEYRRIYACADDQPIRSLQDFHKQWRERVHPDDRAWVRATVEATLESGQPYSADYRLRMDDGEVRHVRVRGEGMDRDELNVAQRWFGTVHDVTELRQAEAELRSSEARYRATLDNALDGVMLHDADGRVLDVNRAACEALGYRREEIIGQTPALFDALLSDEAVDALKERLAHSAGVTMQSRFRRKDGSEFPAEVRISQFRHEGQLQGVSLSRDITERRNLEEQLRQAQKMEAVGQLAGGIAHEFNNLLMIILGHSEMALARMTGNDPNRAALTEILTGGERAAALTRQLLVFSRQQVLNPELLALDACLVAWRQFMRPLISEDIEFQLELGTLNAPVRIDRVQFEQAMTNLVINARDAMPAGGTIRIEVASVAVPARRDGVRVYGAAQGYAQITVHDQGHGMNESVQARVFEPFFTTKPVGHGTGLGLAMVYGFVTQSGGDIDITSTPGVGTSVRIRLPLASAEDVVMPAIEAPQGLLFGDETVLVVEDEPAVRTLCREMLLEAGYTVLEAADGVAALEIFTERAGAIDMLVTDVVMPRMSGPQLAAALSTRVANLPVLFISGHTGAPKTEALPARHALLRKPFHPRELLLEVRRLLDAQPAAMLL